MVSIEKPRSSFSYYLETDEALSPEYAVTVIERPDVKNLVVTLVYPEYTGLGTIVRDDNDGNIRALLGTKAELSISANKQLSSMVLVRNDSTDIPCHVNGYEGKAEFCSEQFSQAWLSKTKPGRRREKIRNIDPRGISFLCCIFYI